MKATTKNLIQITSHNLVRERSYSIHFYLPVIPGQLSLFNRLRNSLFSLHGSRAMIRNDAIRKKSEKNSHSQNRGVKLNKKAIVITTLKRSSILMCKSFDSLSRSLN